MSLCVAKRVTIAFTALILISAPEFAAGIDAADFQRQFEELRQQNQKLQEQLRNQAKMIQSLNDRLSSFTATNQSVTPVSNEKDAEVSGLGEGLNFLGDRLKLSGEAGVGIFHSSSKGSAPNTEFRIDEAKLFLDAKILEDVYFFTELNLTTRESYLENFELGEIYIDFENVSQFFGRERLLNLRVGRFDIPFGEEYQLRDAIDDPLILHSLSDLWGVDEGIELYGELGKFSYVLTVQNGGAPLLRDYNGDKAVVGRLSYDPKKWLHLSVSGMRTGDLSVSGDETSELWFGNGFIRNLSPTATLFHGEVFEGDAQFKFSRGHVKLSGGLLQSDDNAPEKNDFRRNYFYSVEGLQKLTDKFYAAGRFSQILSDSGAPIVGNGTFDRYFYNNANLTKNVWRLSLGLGYRMNRHLLIKAEYSLEDGELLGGRSRRIDFFGAEAAVGF